MGATFLDLTSATEKWIVDDVCRAAIVHKDSPGIESFYCEHYDQGVIMRLLHPSRVFFKEKDVLVHSSLFQRRHLVDAIHLPLI